MTAFANVNGKTVIDAVLYVPNVGPWWSEVTFELDPDVSGAVTLNLGELALSGTVDPTHDGVFGGQRRSRIIAGGGGWGTLVPSQHYHNDGGITALSIAQDAARLAGEQLGTFSPANPSVGIDYVRSAGPASRVLEDVIGGVPWHVDYNGITQVGARTESAAPDDAYEVLESNPRENLVNIAADDLTRIGVGSIFSVGLDAPITAYELEIRVSVEQARTVVWGGGASNERGRLASAITKIVDTVNAARLFGKYRYRVVSMNANRVELQAVSSSVGLPDVLPVSQKPGVAGAHAALTGGSVVIVEFIEGDRTLPIVTAYAGKDEQGHAPVTLDLSVTTTLRLGGDTATEGVALGTSLKAWLDGHSHTYVPGMGSPTQTSVPSTGVVGPGTLDPSPAPSTKVFTE